MEIHSVSCISSPNTTLYCCRCYEPYWADCGLYPWAFLCASSSDFGISIPVGHVDFFLNGGKDQTGCARSRFASSKFCPDWNQHILRDRDVLQTRGSRVLSVLVYFPVYGYVICDHMRALHVFMSALNGSCPLVGIPCPSYEDFLDGQCVDCDVFKGACPVIGNDTPEVTWLLLVSGSNYNSYN